MRAGSMVAVAVLVAGLTGGCGAAARPRAATDTTIPTTSALSAGATTGTPVPTFCEALTNAFTTRPDAPNSTDQVVLGEPVTEDDLKSIMVNARAGVPWLMRAQRVAPPDMTDSLATAVTWFQALSFGDPESAADRAYVSDVYAEQSEPAMAHALEQLTSFVRTDC